jgi:molecular chaperone GrpE (heat shock protein)
MIVAMSDSLCPKLPKWPFLLGDTLLLGMAGAIVWRGAVPLTLSQGGLCVAATAVGAWLCVLPFLRQYQAALQLREAHVLANSIAQLNQVIPLTNQITSATAQWQAVQELSAQTVTAAREITERMKKELAELCSFLQQAQDQEKSHLRLEVEKLRRAERDWLQATVHVLDHVFALQTAGARSGHPTLSVQLNRFQLACRDVVRRLGVVEFAPSAGEAFDPQVHQLHDSDVKPEPGARIAETLAPGYAYQSEVVRRALVRLESAESSAAAGPGALANEH